MSSCACVDKPATTGGAGVRKSTCFACGPSAHFEDSIVGPLHTNVGIVGPIILKGIYLDAGPLYTIRLILELGASVSYFDTGLY